MSARSKIVHWILLHFQFADTSFQHNFTGVFLVEHTSTNSLEFGCKKFHFDLSILVNMIGCMYFDNDAMGTQICVWCKIDLHCGHNQNTYRVLLEKILKNIQTVTLWFYNQSIITLHDIIIYE